MSNAFKFSNLAALLGTSSIAVVGMVRLFAAGMS